MSVQLSYSAYTSTPRLRAPTEPPPNIGSLSNLEKSAVILDSPYLYYRELGSETGPYWNRAFLWRPVNGRDEWTVTSMQGETMWTLFRVADPGDSGQDATAGSRETETKAKVEAKAEAVGKVKMD